MKFLLDTNVISEAIKPSPNHKVVTWLTHHSVSSAISVITIGEIWQGIEMLPKGKRKTGYENWFDAVETDFEGQVIPINLDIIKTWGTYCATLKAKSIVPSSLNSLIAATALHYGMSVVTRNQGDFPDVRTVDPFA